MNKSICLVDQCGRNAHKLGFCNAHYQRLKAHGDVLAEIPVQSRQRYVAGDVCSVEGCGRAPKRSWMCQAHYTRSRRHGAPMAETPLASPRAKPEPVVDFHDGTRICQGCQARKPLADFHRDKKAPLGRRKSCRECRVNIEKARYAADPEHFREKYRIDRQQNKGRYRSVEAARYERDREKRIAAASYHTHIRRARMAFAGIEQGVNLESIRAVDGDNCCYCGVAMIFQSFPRGERPDEQATLEHVVPISRGGSHAFNNCALACWRCNITKGASDDWIIRSGHRLSA